MKRSYSISLIFCICSLFWSLANATPSCLRIAVASNFVKTVQTFSETYDPTPLPCITIISGSSGKLTSQLINGAPFDIFLSADATTLEPLKKNKLIYQNLIYDYALGIMVFVSNPANKAQDLKTKIHSCHTIAIANPQHAPYGRAAQQILEGLALYETVKPKLVIGESLGQAMAFLESGAADCALVGLAQTKENPHLYNRTHLISKELYSPILQSAIIVNTSQRKQEAVSFIKHLSHSDMLIKIKEAGYELPKSRTH